MKERSVLLKIGPIRQELSFGRYGFTEEQRSLEFSIYKHRINR
jgi:hypothetical protein